MPWSSQNGGGGPWGSGGNNSGGGRGPWGSPPGSGGNGGGNQPPDLEEFLRRGQDRLKNMVPGGGSFSRFGFGLALAGILLAWGLTGFYRVQPGEIGIPLVLGKVGAKASPGLNFNWPWPVGSVVKVNVTELRTAAIGAGRGSDDSLMLTGDENIVDVPFNVQWTVNPAQPEYFAFNLLSPEDTVQAIAESTMREAVGKRNLQPILTADRTQIQEEVKKEIQAALDSYKAGVVVSNVQLQTVGPPSEAVDAFRDVQVALADQSRSINDGQRYANSAIPEARGQAIEIVQKAEAYRDQTVAEARGQAARFLAVYNAYKAAPDVTRQRMELDAIGEILSGHNKIILDQRSNGGGVLPYLPLDRLIQSRPAAPAGQGAK